VSIILYVDYESEGKVLVCHEGKIESNLLYVGLCIYPEYKASSNLYKVPGLYVHDGKRVYDNFILLVPCVLA